MMLFDELASGWRCIDKGRDARQDGTVILPPLDFTRPLDAAIDAVRTAGRQPVALSMAEHRHDQLKAVMARRGVDASASYRDLPIRAAIEGQSTVAVIDNEGRAYLA